MGAARRARERPTGTGGDCDAGPAGSGPADTAATTESLLSALNPDRQVVPFSPLRGADLRALLAWCEGSDPGRVWQVDGAAGRGKTRLLIEAAHRLEQKGRNCGWARRGKATDAAAALRRGPTLLIIDDTDTSPDHADLAEMVTALEREESTDRIRTVLAAREFGGWWGQLRESLDPALHHALTPSGHTRLAAALGPVVKVDLGCG